MQISTKYAKRIFAVKYGRLILDKGRSFKAASTRTPTPILGRIPTKRNSTKDTAISSCTRLPLLSLQATTELLCFLRLHFRQPPRVPHRSPAEADRKSTRLNSSHRCISYAAF